MGKEKDLGKRIVVDGRVVIRRRKTKAGMDAASSKPDDADYESGVKSLLHDYQTRRSENLFVESKKEK